MESAVAMAGVGELGDCADVAAGKSSNGNAAAQALRIEGSFTAFLFLDQV
jgi:hypothetical protein